MVWRVAYSLNTLLAQLNTLAPNRNKAADGSIGDAAHSARESDHNPDDQEIVRARDFTHDPDGGLNCHWLAAQLARHGDPRVKYIIWDRMIWSGGTWRSYHGVNPHTKHLHLSVVAGAVADDTRPWRLDVAASLPTEEESEAMLLAAKINGTNTYGIYSGGVLTGLTGGGAENAAKRGPLWIEAADWAELDRKSRQLVGDPAAAK